MARVLIGVLSVPPVKRGTRLRAESSRFGTPAIFLPQRQTAQQFDEGLDLSTSRAISSRNSPSLNSSASSYRA